MDEARGSRLFRIFRRLAAPLRSQRGQSLVEFVLVLILALFFTRAIYFNKEFGFKAVLDKTMLRLGSFLELNLKTGTQAGADGTASLDGYAGTNQWSN
jgi:hypothetical protein